MTARILLYASVLSALVCASLALEPTPLVGDAIVGRKTWTDEKVAATFKQAKSDPEALWKLSAAPIDKIFDRLMRLWLDAGGEHWSGILPGFEEQWVDEKSGSKLSIKDQQSIVARKILSGHDQLGAYVQPRVDRLCETFRQRLEIETGVKKREFIMARREAIELLKLAIIRRDYVGVGIIDPFLNCSDERDPAQRNFVETAVPHWALWAMIERHKYLSETQPPTTGQIPDDVRGPVPSDLESARAWWERTSSFLSFFFNESPEPYREPNREPKWTDEKISAVFERAKTNGSALSELRDAPLEKTFDGLMRLWKEDRLAWESRQAKGPAAPRHWGWEVSAGREARKKLAQHADWDIVAASKLDRVKGLFATGRGRGKAADRKELMAAYEEASDILDFAVVYNGNQGYRVIASFLSAPDSIHPRMRGQVKLSPAALARDALAKRLKQRWDEDIPGDIAEARVWWTENQGRFAGDAIQRKPAVPGAKGYMRDVVRVVGGGRAEPTGALTKYIDSIEGVLREHFSEQTEPDQFGFLVTLEPGKLPQHEVFFGSNEIYALLNRSKAPEVTGGKVRVVFKAKVAGGWRYAKIPKDPQDENQFKCGTWGVDEDAREVVTILFGDQFGN